MENMRFQHFKEEDRTWDKFIVVDTLSVSKLLGYLLSTEYRSMGWCAKAGRRILAFRKLISRKPDICRYAMFMILWGKIEKCQNGYKNKNFKLNWSWWAITDGQGLTEEVTWQIRKLSILRPGRAEVIYEGITPFSLRHGKHH